jgi:hypothetical protein
MLCVVHQVMRMLLAIALLAGSVITHAGSLSHAAWGDAGASHQHTHLWDAELEALASDEGAGTVEPDGHGSNHTTGLCLDAHCCTPAMQASAHDGLRHALQRGTLRAAAPSESVKSIAYTLLKPPRTLT